MATLSTPTNYNDASRKYYHHLGGGERNSFQCHNFGANNRTWARKSARNPPKRTPPQKRGVGARLLTILDEYLWWCDDIVFPGSLSRDDDAIFIRPRSKRRAHSQQFEQRRSLSHRRHSHSVGLAYTH